MSFDILTEKDIPAAELKNYEPFSGSIKLNVSTVSDKEIFSYNFIYGVRLDTEILIVYSDSKLISHLSINQNLIIFGCKYINIKRIVIGDQSETISR